ncbi:MAG TPA: FHA domain-containing protein [Conexibacter sp.]|nr:FHA domain-containing protein [Conexibacter sp.]
MRDKVSLPVRRVGEETQRPPLLDCCNHTSLVTPVTCAFDLTPPRRATATEVEDMQALTSGTLAGTGTFRCVECDYVVSLAAADALPPCPSCGGAQFARASLFTSQHSSSDTVPEHMERSAEAWLDGVRGRLDEAGQYLAYEEDGEAVVHELTREWTRIGRSLAADVRFDDPTVSRRHALVVRRAVDAAEAGRHERGRPPRPRHLDRPGGQRVRRHHARPLARDRPQQR